MSSPERRTVLPEADKRQTAPSSARIAGRGQPADPVLAYQRLAARLVTREAPDFALEPGQLVVDLIDDRERDLDPLTGRGREGSSSVRKHARPLVRSS